MELPCIGEYFSRGSPALSEVPASVVCRLQHTITDSEQKLVQVEVHNHIFSAWQRHAWTMSLACIDDVPRTHRHPLTARVKSSFWTTLLDLISGGMRGVSSSVGLRCSPTIHEGKHFHSSSWYHKTWSCLCEASRKSETPVFQFQEFQALNTTVAYWLLNLHGALRSN